MKKIIILAIGLFITGVANAQSTDKAIRLGVKAGANYSNIIKDDGNNDFKTDYLVGYHAGITLDIPLLPNLAFTPEALYSTKGYKSSSTFGDFTQTTHFIDIPILASIKLAEGLKVFPFEDCPLKRTDLDNKHGFIDTKTEIVFVFQHTYQ